MQTSCNKIRNAGTVFNVPGTTSSALSSQPAGPAASSSSYTSACASPPAPQPRTTLSSYVSRTRKRRIPDQNDGHEQKRRRDEYPDPDPNVSDSDVEHSPIPGLVRDPRRPGRMRRRTRKLIGIYQRNCVQYRTRMARTPTGLSNPLVHCLIHGWDRGISRTLVIRICF